MPYAPGIEYRGDKYLYDSISSLGSDFAAVLEERRKTEKDLAASDTIVNSAYKSGNIDEEQYNKYLSGSSKQKQGIAFGVVSNIHEKWQGMKDQAEIESAKARTEAVKQQLFADRAQRTWQPSPEEQGQAAAGGYTYVPTAKGMQPVEYPKGQQDSWETLNKDARAATGYDLGDWQGAKNKRVENGYVVADIVKPNVFGDEVQHTIRVPQTTYNQFLGRFNSLKGGQPGADIGVEQAPKQAAEPPTIKSEAEWNALSAGSLYIDVRDGKLKRKK